MAAYRTSILPLFALLMVVFGISYSACHDSKADAPAGGPTQELRKEISQFEQELTDLRKVHEDQIKQYSNEMGCIGESKTLEIINAHNALLDHFKQRLEYHKLQMIQADTTNSERNKHQLEELKKDEQELTNNSEEIRNGLEAFTPTHVTK